MRKYQIGDIIKCRVTGIQNYGIFVSVDDYSGLIHISEISDLFVRSVFDYAEIGDIIKAKIIDIDENNSNLKLSIKNINYRNNIKNSKKIKETKNGFLTLENKLDDWVKEKKIEISNDKG